MKNTPTNEQIKKVEEIASALGIVFPVGSIDFSYKKYKAFIKRYEATYQHKMGLNETN